jgi:hypothetical protein
VSEIFGTRERNPRFAFARRARAGAAAPFFVVAAFIVLPSFFM